MPGIRVPHAVRGLSRRSVVLRAIAAVLLVAGGIAALVLRAESYLPQYAGGGSYGPTQLQVGHVWALGAMIENTSPDTPMTLEEVRLASPLPAHVHLLHTMVTPLAALGYNDWPPAFDNGKPIPLFPVQGYRVPPGAPKALDAIATALFALVADAPGTYRVGPVTVRILAPGFFGTPLGALPVERTYQSYGTMCVEVSQAVCDAALSDWEQAP